MLWNLMLLPAPRRPPGCADHAPDGKRETRSQTFHGRFTTIGELHDHNLAARYHLLRPRTVRDIHQIGCTAR
jgi:hypothetical protein